MLMLPVAFAQKAPDPRTSPKATVIRPTALYLQGDTGSDKLSTVQPGREMAILERSGHWIKVYANTDQETVQQADQPVFTEHEPEHPISGWVQDPGVIAADTPNGAAVLFGVAITAEQAASEPHAAAGSALDARRLYRMVAVLFPDDARTPEAMWRTADIRWQLQKEDASTLPSAHEKESYLRQQPDETEMKRLERQFPGTKWASFAAYALIDNKLCGDWQGAEKCPEKEASYYAEFADKYPDSPKAAQALYEAAWRLACAGDMWSADNDDKRAAEDRRRSVETAAHLGTRYTTTDYAARGAGLIYKVQQSIPVYGSDRQ
ncbi:hypothetical protein D1Y84_11360 [Acidipila sp. EB88]|nr:hypothetical protein D1Y84_11360 [Acidipila sp. EB88]